VTVPLWPYLESVPSELRVAIEEFWPESEWENAAAIATLESGGNAFALHDSVTEQHPCGSIIGSLEGVKIAAERSVGYFQINSCNYPTWEWQRFYNARHNAGTAHLLWSNAGERWTPWYFSAKRLGFI
jgi:hypothetical protein